MRLLIKGSVISRKVQSVSYVRGSGLSIDLVNAVAQSNHIAAGGFGGRARRILSKFCLVDSLQ